MERSLAGMTIAVTGGASGIGEACAVLAARAGARVAIIDIEEKKASSAVYAIRSEGGEAAAYQLDIRNSNMVDSVFNSIEVSLGPINGMVASAGILQVPESPEKLTIESWDEVIQINQRGVYLSCLAAGRRMAQRGEGAIVTMASVAGMRSTPLHAYAPAKAAVISMTENLACEWGRSGVRVNAVSPGYTLTPSIREAIERGHRDPSALMDNSALGRMVEPEEVAEGVLFLLSPRARGITGATIPIDAGWLVAPSWHTYGGLPALRGGSDAQS